MQEKGLRTVYNNATSTYESLLKTANMPTLCNRRLQDLVNVMFKVKNGMSSWYISEQLQTWNANYNFHNSDFVIPRYNNGTDGKHSTQYLGPYLQQKLLIKIRSLWELNSFKKNIRKMSLADLELVDNQCGTECNLCNSLTFKYFNVVCLRSIF